MLRSTVEVATPGSLCRLRTSSAAVPSFRRFPSSSNVTASSEERRSPESVFCRIPAVREASTTRIIAESPALWTRESGNGGQTGRELLRSRPFPRGGLPLAIPPARRPWRDLVENRTGVAEDFIGGVGFSQDGLRTGPQHFSLELRVEVSAGEQDSGVRVDGTQPEKRLPSSLFREPHVQDHEIDPVPLTFVDLHSFHSVPRGEDVVPLVFEQRLDRFEQHVLILNEQDRLRADRGGPRCLHGRPGPFFG